jgi:hypothetical protein
MDEAIRAKVASGDLPREDWDRTRMVIGGPAAGLCVGCDTPTTAENLAVSCEGAGRRVILHLDCYALWEQAREDEHEP